MNLPFTSISFLHIHSLHLCRTRFCSRGSHEYLTAGPAPSAWERQAPHEAELGGIVPVLAQHSRAAKAGGPNSSGLSPGWVRLQQLWTPHPCSVRGLRELGRVAPVIFVPFLQLQMLLRRGTPQLLEGWGGVRLSSVPGPMCWYPDYILKEVGSGHGKRKQLDPQSAPL